MKLPLVGAFETNSKTYTEAMVRQFAELSGDKNPLHLDNAYASKSLFKKRIVHGILVAGQISSILAEQLPGPGSIYLHQSLNFKKPVFWNEKIFCKVTVEKVEQEKSLIFLHTVCYKEGNEIVIEGNAIIKKI